jgi:UPF0176 protein
MPQYVVCALYHFVILEDFESLKQPLLNVMEKNQIKGTVLVAREGINGTVSGSREGIDAFLKWLKSDPRFNGLVAKESFDKEQPFYRTKVKLKKEIVTMGVENIDPKEIVGTYIKPNQWNQLISEDDVVVVDTRNDYETAIGSFENALTPETTTFREFPKYVAENLDPKQHKKVAMFCTGGIRCEKSTAYLKQQGFEEVYHLEGGILKYLEEVPEAESMWQGECFVFDNRVAVNHQLEKGSYDQCFACRMPLSEQQLQHSDYQKGVSCHYCINDTDKATKAKFEERQKQITLAKQRGEVHLGSSAVAAAEQHRIEKKLFKQHQREDAKIKNE